MTERPLIRPKVAPFSGANYTKNSGACRAGFTPCAICGRGIRNGTEKFAAVVTGGGGTWGDAQSDESDPGYMGLWPIGNDCARKYVERAP